MKNLLSICLQINDNKKLCARLILVEFAIYHLIVASADYYNNSQCTGNMTVYLIYSQGNTLSGTFNLGLNR